MSEMMLRDAGRAHDLRYVILRYFNVAGADPRGRTGHRRKAATHLIKVAGETALGKRAALAGFRHRLSDADGSCVRDYIHVTDLARAHSDALRHLRGGGQSLTLNCGYGHGFLGARSGRRGQARFRRRFQGRDAPRRPGDPARDRGRLRPRRATLGWQPHFDDLATIVTHALAWERALINAARRAPTAARNAISRPQRPAGSMRALIGESA